MYSALPIRLDGGAGDYHHRQGALSLDGTNLPGDACLILTTDPKPRLRWTADLHDRFVDAVTQLGGPHSGLQACNKCKLASLTEFRVHSAKCNRKYRLGKQSSKEAVENSKDASFLAESQDTGSSSSASSRMVSQELNNGYQVTEALQLQMEIQQRLHEQLEVQRRLQLRIETQSKYLQSVLEKACKVLNNQAVASEGLLEASREELSELAIKVANDSQGIFPPPSFPQVSVECSNCNILTSN